MNDAPLSFHWNFLPNFHDNVNFLCTGEGVKWNPNSMSRVVPRHVKTTCDQLSAHTSASSGTTNNLERHKSQSDSCVSVKVRRPADSCTVTWAPVSWHRHSIAVILGWRNSQSYHRKFHTQITEVLQLKSCVLLYCIYNVTSLIVFYATLRALSFHIS